MSKLSLKSNCLPGSIRALLKLLIEKEVVLVLKTDCKPQCVEIEAVVGNLVIVEDNNNFRFIDIDCICEVIVSCHELLEALLGDESDKSDKSDKAVSTATPDSGKCCK